MLVKLIEDCRLLAQTSLDDPSLSATSRLKPDTEKKLDLIDDYSKKLGNVMDFLMDSLLQNFGNMGALFLTIDILFILLLLVLSILLYFFLWTPFVKNLKEKIWRARSMINLIPFEMIVEDKQLMKAMKHAHFN